MGTRPDNIMMTVHIADLRELRQFAERFSRELESGDIIGLVGDLGAGKTTFVQLLAAALGVKKKVKSPTFVLLQAFPTGPQGKIRGLGELCHVDAYRLKDEKELVQVGLDDYAGRRGVVTVVEWADRAPSLHGLKNYREITFIANPDATRTLRIGGRP